MTLAKYYMLKGDADKAHQYLTSSHLYENDPSPEYLLILAEVELATNRLPEAERHLLQAIESDPDLAKLLCSCPYMRLQEMKSDPIHAKGRRIGSR